MWFSSVAQLQTSRSSFTALSHTHPLSPVTLGFCWSPEPADYAFPGEMHSSSTVPPAPHWTLWLPQIQLPLQERQQVRVGMCGMEEPCFPACCRLCRLWMLSNGMVSVGGRSEESIPFTVNWGGPVLACKGQLLKNASLHHTGRQSVTIVV